MYRFFSNKSLKFLIYIAVVLFITAVYSVPIFALTNQELKYTIISPLYDPTEAYECVNNSTVLVGSDNAEKIWNYLTDARRGLSAEQAAGIMGNLARESGYNPEAVEGGSGIGYGIAQWSFGRRDALEKAAKEQGVYVGDLAFQLDFLFNESKSREAIYPPEVAGQSEWEGLKTIPSPDGLSSITDGKNAVEDAVIYWEKNFERAGVVALGQRLEFAYEALSNFGNGENGTGSGTQGVARCDSLSKTENDVEFVSWNVLKTSSKENLIRGIQSFSDEQIDIIGLQEVSFNNKPETVVELTEPGCEECMYASYKPRNAADGGNVPILWRKARFALEDSGNKKVHDEVNVEPGAGSEDGTESAMSITYVKLRDNVTDKSFWVLNVHTIATVESGGEPNGLDKRLDVYEKTMNDLISIAKPKSEPVFILGDFNVDYRKDSLPENRYNPFPYRKLGIENGILSNWQWLELNGGTLPEEGTLVKNRRLIDYVFLKKTSAASFRSTRIGESFSSDHNSVYAIYRLNY